MKYGPVPDRVPTARGVPVDLPKASTPSLEGGYGSQESESSLIGLSRLVGRSSRLAKGNGLRPPGPPPRRDVSADGSGKQHYSSEASDREDEIINAHPSQDTADRPDSTIDLSDSDELQEEVDVDASQRARRSKGLTILSLMAMAVFAISFDTSETPAVRAWLNGEANVEPARITPPIKRPVSERFERQIQASSAQGSDALESTLAKRTTPALIADMLAPLSAIAEKSTGSRARDGLRQGKPRHHRPPRNLPPGR